MYKESRRAAGLSIESASMQLHIGGRTLINYENGHTIAPPDVVLRMAEVYDDPLVRARYCSDYCPIGQRHAHRVETVELAEAALQLLKEHGDVGKLRDNLIAIAADGKITPDEEQEFSEILNELEHLEKVIQQIRIKAEQLGAQKKKGCLGRTRAAC